MGFSCVCFVFFFFGASEVKSTTPPPLLFFAVEAVEGGKGAAAAKTSSAAFADAGVAAVTRAEELVVEVVAGVDTGADRSPFTISEHFLQISLLLGFELI